MSDVIQSPDQFNALEESKKVKTQNIISTGDFDSGINAEVAKVKPEDFRTYTDFGTVQTGLLTPQSKWVPPNVAYAAVGDEYNQLYKWQPGTAKFANSIIGGLAGGALTALEEFGYLLDVPGRLARWETFDGIQDNDVSAWARKAQADVEQNILPIYRKDPNKIIDFSDRGFYWDTFRSIIESAVGFGIPGLAIGSALKGITTAFKLSRTLADIITTVGTAINTNYGEGKQMAMQTFAANMDALKEKQVTDYAKQLRESNPDLDNVAIQEASDQWYENTYKQSDDYKNKRLEIGRTADRIVDWNRTNMLEDIAMVHGALTGKGLLVKGVEKKSFGQFAKLAAMQAPLQGFEEMEQNVIQEEFTYQGLKSAGLDVSKYSDNFVQRATDAFTNESSLLQGAMGFISGPLQYGVMQAHPYFKGITQNNAEYIKQVAANEDDKKFLRTNLGNLAIDEIAKRQATANGDFVSEKETNDKSIVERTFDALERNGASDLKNELNAIINGQKVEGVENAPALAKDLLSQVGDIESAYKKQIRSEKVGNRETMAKNEELRKPLFLASQDIERYSSIMSDTNKKINTEIGRLESTKKALLDAYEKRIDPKTSDVVKLRTQVKGFEDHIAELKAIRQEQQDNFNQLTTQRDQINSFKNKFTVPSTTQNIVENADGTVSKVNVPVKEVEGQPTKLNSSDMLAFAVQKLRDGKKMSTEELRWTMNELLNLGSKPHVQSSPALNQEITDLLKLTNEQNDKSFLEEVGNNGELKDHIDLGEDFNQFHSNLRQTSDKLKNYDNTISSDNGTLETKKKELTKIEKELKDLQLSKDHITANDYEKLLDENKDLTDIRKLYKQRQTLITALRIAQEAKKTYTDPKLRDIEYKRRMDIKNSKNISEILGKVIEGEQKKQNEFLDGLRGKVFEITDKNSKGEDVKHQVILNPHNDKDLLSLDYLRSINEGKPTSKGQWYVRNYVDQLVPENDITDREDVKFNKDEIDKYKDTVRKKEIDPSSLNPNDLGDSNPSPEHDDNIREDKEWVPEKRPEYCFMRTAGHDYFETPNISALDLQHSVKRDYNLDISEDQAREILDANLRWYTTMENVNVGKDSPYRIRLVTSKSAPANVLSQVVFLQKSDNPEEGDIKAILTDVTGRPILLADKLIYTSMPLATYISQWGSKEGSGNSRFTFKENAIDQLPNGQYTNDEELISAIKSEAVRNGARQKLEEYKAYRKWLYDNSPSEIVKIRTKSNGIETASTSREIQSISDTILDDGDKTPLHSLDLQVVTGKKGEGFIDNYGEKISAIPGTTYLTYKQQLYRLVSRKLKSSEVVNIIRLLQLYSSRVKETHNHGEANTVKVGNNVYSLFETINNMIAFGKESYESTQKYGIQYSNGYLEFGPDHIKISEEDLIKHGIGYDSKIDDVVLQDTASDEMKALVTFLKTKIHHVNNVELKASDASENVDESKTKHITILKVTQKPGKDGGNPINTIEDNQKSVNYKTYLLRKDSNGKSILGTTTNKVSSNMRVGKKLNTKISDKQFTDAKTNRGKIGIYLNLNNDHESIRPDIAPVTIAKSAESNTNRGIVTKTTTTIPGTDINHVFKIEDGRFTPDPTGTISTYVQVEGTSEVKKIHYNIIFKVSIDANGKLSIARVSDHGETINKNLDDTINSADAQKQLNGEPGLAKIGSSTINDKLELSEMGFTEYVGKIVPDILVDRTYSYYQTNAIPIAEQKIISNTSDGLDHSKEIHLGDEEVFRLADHKLGDTSYLKVSAKEAEWWKQVFPDMPEKVINGLVKGKAYAQLVDGSKLLISDMAASGTRYHEGYHKVSLVLSTPEERQGIYKAYRDYYKSENLNDRQVEEKLANMFMEYMLADGHYNIPKQKISNMFKRMWEFIKGIFGKSQYQITNNKLKEQFENIAKGRISSTVKSVATYSPFLETKGSDFERSMNDSLNAYFFRELFIDDAVMFSDIFTMNGEEFGEKYKDQISNIYNKSLGIMLGHIGDKYRAIQESISQEISKKTPNQAYLDGMAEENATLKSLHNSLGEDNSKLWKTIVDNHAKTLSRFNIELSFDGDFDEMDDAKNSNDSPAHVSSMEFSQKEKATAIIKMLVAGLPQSETKNGVAEPTRNGYGLLSTVDYAEIFNFLHVNLAGIQSFAGQIQKLRDLQTIVPSLKWITRRMGIKDDNVGEYTPLGMSSNRQLLQNQFYQQFNKTTMEPLLSLITRGEDGKTEVRTMNSQSVNLVKHIVDKWESMGRFLSGVKGSVLSTNSAGEIVVDVNKVIQLANGKTATVKNASKLPFDEQVDVLGHLGINLFNANIFDSLDDKILSQLRRDVNKVFEIINNDKNKTNSLAPLYNQGVNDVVGRVKSIANIFGKVNPSSIETQHISPDGKTLYGIAMNSYLSMVVNEYNTGSIPEFISQSTYAKNSQWLNMIKDKKGKISFTYLEGVKREGDPGVTIEKATAGDRLFIQINAVLDGVMPFIRAADRKVENGMRVDGFGRKMTTDQFVEVLWKYLEDEINSSTEHLQSFKDNDTRYYSDNIQKLRFFKNIITYANKEVVDLNGIEHFDDFVTKFGKDRIQSQLEEYANKLVANTTDLLYKHGIFVKEGDEKVFITKNLGVSPEKLALITSSTNNELNSDQIYALSSTYAYNFIIGNIEQTKMFVGDPAYYENKNKQNNPVFGMSSMYKRMRGVNSTKKIVRTDDQLNKWMDENMPRSDGKRHTDTFNTIVTKDPIYIPTIEGYDGKEEADGQGYISLDAYRELMWKQGEWFGPQEKLYQWITKGRVGEKPDAMFPPLKPQYFGPRMNVKDYIPTFYKFSVVPIYEGLFENKDVQLNKLISEMKDKQIDMVLQESAVKVGALTVNGDTHPFYNPDGTIADLDIKYNQQINLKYFGTQLDIAPELHENVTYGTQFRSLIFSNIYSNGIAVDDHLAYLGNEMKDIIQSLIKEDLRELISNLGLHINDDNTYSFDNNDKKLIENVVAKEMQRRGFSQNDLDGWEYTINHEHAFIDFMSSRERVENMLFALVRNRVTTQKMNGDMLILAASTGWETKPRKQKDNKWASNMPTLKFYSTNADGSTSTMEVYMPNVFKDHFKIGTTVSLRNGSMYDEHDNLISNDKRLINVVGFRTPTSGLNSIENITIKGFLPREAGGTIVVPSDIVEKAGCDYDVDKMTVFVPNHYINSDGAPVYIESLDQYDDYVNSKNTDKKHTLTTYQFERKLRQNKIIAISQEILSHPSSRKNLLEPISSKVLKDISDKVVEQKGIVEDEMMFSPSQLSDIADRFWAGIGGIGIAALNNTNNIKGQQAGLYVDIDPNSMIFDGVNSMNVDGKDVVSISGAMDVNNNSISETLNQVIQGVVDIGKDPFLSNINMNIRTLNMYALLIRAGIDVENISYFISQPIIVKYIEQLNLNDSKFYKANYNNFAKSKAQIQRSLRESYGAEPFTPVSFKHFSKSELFGMLKTPATKEDKLDQVRILDAYIKYEKIAGDLTTLIQALNQDTVANGNRNDYAARRLKFEYAMQNEPGDDGNFSSIGNVKKILDNTFMGEFDRAEIAGKAIFDPLFFVEQNKEVANELNSIRNTILDLKVKSSLKQSAMTKIEAGILNYLLQTAKDKNNISLGDRVQELLHGNTAVANRFIEYPGISVLKSELTAVIEGSKNTRDEQAVNSYIKLMNRRLDAYDVDELVNAFKELKSNDPTLYNDMIDLLILTSGIGNTPISYKQILPAKDFYNRMISIISNLAPNINFSPELRMLIARANWRDNIISPPIKEYTKMDDGLIEVPKKDKQGNPINLPFNIGKISVSRKNGTSGWNLYQVIYDKEGVMVMQYTSKTQFIGRVNYTDTVLHQTETELGKSLREANEANFLGENNTTSTDNSTVTSENLEGVTTPVEESSVITFTDEEASKIIIPETNPLRGKIGDKEWNSMTDLQKKYAIKCN